MKHPIQIRLNPGEAYQDNLRERLAKYGITQLAVSEQMGIPASQFSRWFKKDEDGRYLSTLFFETVVQIEEAIGEIRYQRARKGRLSG